MKKIGILTFHMANNYGAFLQAYSLNHVLALNSNIDVEIINYICPAIEKNYDPKLILQQNGNIIKKQMKYLLRKPGISQNKILFQDARDNYFNVCSKRLSDNDMKEIETNYDLIIVGSDQVWNLELTQNDYTFFLNFTSETSKKASYAASLGECNWNPQEQQTIRRLLNDFSTISIREEEGTETVRKLTGRNDIMTCVDPVFLQTKSEWERFAVCPAETGYILFFMMGTSVSAEAALQFAKKIAKRERRRILLLSDQDRPYNHPELKHLKDVCPQKFIGYIKNASCIITNSFHATAFSIILEKDFFVETNIRRNGRILELLSHTGLTNRALYNGKPKDNEVPINWDKVKSNMKTRIADSMLYLKKITNITS